MKFSSLTENKSYCFIPATWTVICQPRFITQDPLTCCRNPGRIQGKRPRCALDSKQEKNISHSSDLLLYQHKVASWFIPNLTRRWGMPEELYLQHLLAKFWPAKDMTSQFSSPFLFCCQNSEKGTESILFSSYFFQECSQE